MGTSGADCLPGALAPAPPALPPPTTPAPASVYLKCVSCRWRVLVCVFCSSDDTCHCL